MHNNNSSHTAKTNKTPSARRIAQALNQARSGRKADLFARTNAKPDTTAEAVRAQRNMRDDAELHAELPDIEMSADEAAIQPNHFQNANFQNVNFQDMARYMPSKRQTMRFLFSPQIGLSLQGIGQSFALLVRTFALLLISVKLLPKKHPAARLEYAAHYGIIRLMTQAARRLRFTRRHVPQLAVYFSIVAFMVCSVMTALTLLSKLAFGVAFAAGNSTNGTGTSVTSVTPGIGSNFTVGSGDYALNVINAIFDPSSQSGNGSSAPAISALGEMFSLYSNAVLILAGFILLYIVLSAVAETARTGTPFGKQFNPVWAPIRIIVALGLLIPISNGLNSGQLMTIGLAKWGSNKATEMWSAFVAKVDQNKGAFVSAPASVTEGKELAESAYEKALAAILTQAIADNSGSDNMNVSNFDQSEIRNVSIDDADRMGWYKNEGKSSTRQIFSFITFGSANQKTLDKDSIGGYVFDKSVILPGATSGSATMDGAARNAELVFDVHEKSVLSMLKGTNSIAKNQYGNSVNISMKDLGVTNTAGIPGTPTGGGAYGLAYTMAKHLISTYYKHEDPAVPLPADFSNQLDTFKQQFVTQRQTAVDTALSQFGNTFGQDLQEEIKANGWIGAATWLNKIAAANQTVMDAAMTAPNIINGAPPSEEALALMKQGHVETEILDLKRSLRSKYALNDEAENMLAKFRMITKPSNNPMGTLAASGRFLMNTGVAIVYPDLIDAVGSNENSASGALDVCTKDALASCSKSDWVKLMGTLYKNDPHLAAQITDYTPQDVARSDTQRKALQRDFAQRFQPVGMSMMAFGFQLGYLLPLIPFFRFFIGILSWIVLLFECILAIPLLALAHLKTDGEGFMSSMAQQGYLMILGLILRPILMVFGLILGLVAFNSITQLTNAMIAPASAMAMGNDAGHMVNIGVTMLLYASFLTVIANSAFKTIDILPGQVMRWIGSNVDSRMDDASMVQSQATQTLTSFGMMSSMNRGQSQSAGTATQTGNGANTNPAASDTHAATRAVFPDKHQSTAKNANSGESKTVNSPPLNPTLGKR